jgi:hypothetical protein
VQILRLRNRRREHGKLAAQRQRQLSCVYPISSDRELLNLRGGFISVIAPLAMAAVIGGL